MKKVSTAVTKQDRNFSQPTLTIGLGLGDRNSWYCVLDEAAQIQVEQRVRTTGKALREAFGGMPRSQDCAGDRDTFAVDQPPVE